MKYLGPIQEAKNLKETLESITYKDFAELANTTEEKILATLDILNLSKEKQRIMLAEAFVNTSDKDKAVAILLELIQLKDECNEDSIGRKGYCASGQGHPVGCVRCCCHQAQQCCNK
jgi:hypothetical protein